MLTPRDAAELLAADAPLPAVAAALGFGPAMPLPARERRALRDAAGFTDPGTWHVAAGADTRRALLVVCPTALDEHALPRLARNLARSLARRFAHCRWLLLLADGPHLTIAAPAVDDPGPLPILRVDRSQVRASDAETVAALVAAADGEAALVHLRWRETLGRDALSRRFYRDLERCVAQLATTAVGRADAVDRRALALLATSRLLFLAFLEAKGWLDRDRAFLRHHMERCAGGRGLHRRLLEPLFFGTLNTPVRARAAAARAFGRVPFLNGGLFARSPLERRHRQLRFTDHAIADVIGGLLTGYRLTARETSTIVSDAAVDPEMLGRAFESLMAAATRRAHGAFYTPHALIVRLADRALAATTATAPRVLDPTCGSGAFLVYVLEALAVRRQAQGDPRTLGAIRREVLTNCIFGVDIDPTAVWLCQLRLWLAVVVEEEYDDPMRLPPLPNLDRNVREGDALAGEGFAGDPLPLQPRDGDATRLLRLRYTKASGRRKLTLARVLDRDERGRAIAAVDRRLEHAQRQRRDLLLVARGPDLFLARRGTDAATARALRAWREQVRQLRRERRRLLHGGALPFGFGTHFPDVATAGGFDVVLGNPPWVRPHAIPDAQRDTLRARFETARAAAWDAGAEAAGAGRGFGSQVDLAALCTERSVQLLRADGVLALLLPSKLWGSLAGGGLRRLLRDRCAILALDDWSAVATGFDAVVYPSTIVARRSAAACTAEIDLTRHRPTGATTWRCSHEGLALDDTPGAPWLMLPPDVRRAFDHLAAAGCSLATSPLGRPVLGVKTGCNAAFVIARAERDQLEPALLRPILRGEDLAAWRPQRSEDRLLWTHDARGMPRRELPARARERLARWRTRLESRSDARGAAWWALFRTEAARSDRPRVVWGDIGRAPRASVIAAGDRVVPLNTCYVVRTATEQDAQALAALLNSRLAAAWLACIAEPARGGYHRYLGWTCARLPLPRDWPRACAVLAPIAAAAAQGAAPEPDALDAAVAAAFGIALADVQALRDWVP